jgi:hypothetical protein
MGWIWSNLAGNHAVEIGNRCAGRAAQYDYQRDRMQEDFSIGLGQEKFYNAAGGNDSRVEN